MNKLSLRILGNKELEKKVNKILINKKIDFSEYIANLIDNDINSKVYFGKGFYFHQNMNKVFHENKQIDFSRVEFITFKYLFDNRNKVVIYDELLEIIEVNHRNNLANIISKIRAKTYKGFIKIIRNEGYMMSIDN